jgi:hypothetical protein
MPRLIHYPLVNPGWTIAKSGSHQTLRHHYYYVLLLSDGIGAWDITWTPRYHAKSHVHFPSERHTWMPSWVWIRGFGVTSISWLSPLVNRQLSMKWLDPIKMPYSWIIFFFKNSRNQTVLLERRNLIYAGISACVRDSCFRVIRYLTFVSLLLLYLLSTIFYHSFLSYSMVLFSFSYLLFFSFS